MGIDTTLEAQTNHRPPEGRGTLFWLWFLLAWVALIYIQDQVPRWQEQIFPLSCRFGSVEVFFKRGADLGEAQRVFYSWDQSHPLGGNYGFGIDSQGKAYASFEPSPGLAESDYRKYIERVRSSPTVEKTVIKCPPLFTSEGRLIERKPGWAYKVLPLWWVTVLPVVLLLWRRRHASAK